MSLFGLLGLAIIGTLSGIFAKFLYPHHKSMNWPETMLLGIGGSLFGGWIGRLLHIGDGSPGGLFTATIGALLLLYLYDRLLKGRRR